MALVIPWEKEGKKREDNARWYQDERQLKVEPEIREIKEQACVSLRVGAETDRQTEEADGGDDDSSNPNDHAWSPYHRGITAVKGESY